jgi:hypothetical protein
MLRITSFSKWRIMYFLNINKIFDKCVSMPERVFVIFWWNNKFNYFVFHLSYILCMISNKTLLVICASYKYHLFQLAFLHFYRHWAGLSFDLMLRRLSLNYKEYSQTLFFKELNNKIYKQQTKQTPTKADDIPPLR